MKIARQNYVVTIDLGHQHVTYTCNKYELRSDWLVLEFAIEQGAPEDIWHLTTAFPNDKVYDVVVNVIEPA